jgi:hypothetical protein
MKKTILLVLVLAFGQATEQAKADFTFGEPVNLGPPINTSSWEWTLVISPDNLQMYVNSDRPGGLGYFDIWRSTRENLDDPWGSLVNVQEINSSYNESFPCFSADGLTLYYSDWYTWNTAGDRPGGVGNHDLWMRTRLSTDDPWGPAVNMGSTVNSPAAEVAPCISQDGQILIFTSNRSGGRGDYDLWMSTRPDVESDWAVPVNLGSAVNSSAYDGETWLSPDGLALFFSSSRPGGMGSYDLYLTTRRSRDAAWSQPVNLGPAINTGSGEGAPSVSPDLKTLYFTSDRPGGIGGWDMYEVSIMPIVDFNGDGMIEIGDLLLLIESWGHEDPTTDIGPAPWGDGIVDAADLEVLMSYWGKEVIDPTLVAYWPLDETEGMFAADSIGDNDAFVVGGALWQPDSGQVDGALQLDGLSGCAIAGFVLNPVDGPFSIFAWVNGGAPGQVVVSQQGAANWLAADAEGNLITELKCTGRSTGPLYSETVITDGQWHRIGLVWDGSHRTLYVDGVAVADDIQPGLESSQMGLYIGTGKAMEPGTYFSGLIDEIRIYNRAVRP